MAEKLKGRKPTTELSQIAYSGPNPKQSEDLKDGNIQPGGSSGPLMLVNENQHPSLAPFSQQSQRESNNDIPKLLDFESGIKDGTIGDGTIGASNDSLILDP